MEILALELLQIVYSYLDIDTKLALHIVPQKIRQSVFVYKPMKCVCDRRDLHLYFFYIYFGNPTIAYCIVFSIDRKNDITVTCVYSRCSDRYRFDVMHSRLLHGDASGCRCFLQNNDNI